LSIAELSACPARTLKHVDDRALLRGQKRDAPEIECKLCSVLQCVWGERGKI
jgi:hypothetical protein